MQHVQPALQVNIQADSEAEVSAFLCFRSLIVLLRRSFLTGLQTIHEDMAALRELLGSEDPHLHKCVRVCVRPHPMACTNTTCRHHTDTARMPALCFPMSVCTAHLHVAGIWRPWGLEAMSFASRCCC